MKIAVVGGGPGGLFFSILTKKNRPEYQIDVFERNAADESFGFGVVFSDETLNEFLSRDPETYKNIRDHFAYWDNLDIVRDGEKTTIGGNGFCGCSRKTLLRILQNRCSELGVNLHFNQEVNTEQLDSYQMIVAADGIGSLIRNRFGKEFGTTVELQQNHFVWMGSTRPLDSFAYFFRNTPHGPMVAHSYQYEEGKSTWIFECEPSTWQKAGFDIENERDTCEKLEQLFIQELEGHKLITNKSFWRKFPRVSNEKWSHRNIVLLGDAKATAHFSIGSGTKLAMESAIALSDSVVEHGNQLENVFSSYEKARRGSVSRIQEAADISLHWFENLSRHMAHPFHRFAFGVMSRARRVTFENLKARDSDFTQKVVNEFNLLEASHSLSPAFSPYKIGLLEIKNRLVMSPMGQYCAEEGLVHDWHLTHYGARAVGGVGLIIGELTAIEADGRITEGCAGIYTDSQKHAWQRITDFVHKNSDCKIGLQIGHSGAKGAVNPPFKGGKSIENPWIQRAASPIAFTPERPVPIEIDKAEMDRLVKLFEDATKRADEAGFDMIEMQAHHGFLLAGFISPLTNKRSDEFGGSLENRMKFPLKVLQSIRKVLSSHKPISVRISASDYAPGGLSTQEAVQVAQMFHKHGADIINVSSGLTVSYQDTPTGSMWQVPLSDLIRNEGQVPTITAGSIEDMDQANTILLAGKADLVSFGKPLLIDPWYVRRMEAFEGSHNSDFPVVYSSTKPLLDQLAERNRKEKMRRTLKSKPKSHG